MKILNFLYSLLSSRRVHSFICYGGNFVMFVCIYGAFTFNENFLDGIIRISFISFIPGLFLYFFFKTKTMIEEEVHNFPFSKLYELDTEKFKKDLAKYEREKLLTPFFSWLSFVCVVAAFKSELNDMLVAQVILLICAFIPLRAVIEILKSYPKPEKQRV